MTQGKNYYVIVGRVGTQPVTRWEPASVTPETRGDQRKDSLAPPLKPHPLQDSAKARTITQ